QCCYTAGMIDLPSIFLAKAAESLDGAASEAANGRYNNCANRCYYACFQAAVAALARAGITSPGTQGQWGHSFVPRQFNGQLIHRRKLYPSALRDVLPHLYQLRQAADYSDDITTQVVALRALRRAREFVASVQERGGQI